MHVVVVSVCDVNLGCCMMCRNPFVKDSSGRIFKASLLSGNLELAVGAIPFPCGQCLPCRINKRRVGTYWLMLELFCHDLSCFVTLTYDDEHISENHSLVKRDVQLFMKRLRKAFEPRKSQIIWLVNMAKLLHVLIITLSFLVLVFLTVKLSAIVGRMVILWSGLVLESLSNMLLVM